MSSTHSTPCGGMPGFCCSRSSATCGPLNSISQRWRTLPGQSVAAAMERACSGDTCLAFVRHSRPKTWLGMLVRTHIEDAMKHSQPASTPRGSHQQGVLNLGMFVVRSLTCKYSTGSAGSSCPEALVSDSPADSASLPPEASASAFPSAASAAIAARFGGGGGGGSTPRFSSSLASTEPSKDTMPVRACRFTSVL